MEGCNEEAAMSVWLAQHGDAFRAAVRRLAASPVNTLLSLLAIGVALALPAGGQMLVGNVLQLARNSAPTPQISMFLDLDAGKNAGQELQARLKEHPGVKVFKFIPREETLARMKTREGLAASTAFLFITGMAPGNPRHTGQTWEFGGSL
jgi:cell division transport system permease protein